MKPTVYTYQLAQWRALKELDLELIDTTVRSGESRLAPTWEMVLAVKRGHLDQTAYEREYRALMARSQEADPEFWAALLRQPAFAIGCYCRPYTFCHRYLLLEILLEQEVIVNGGEIPTTEQQEAYRKRKASA